MLTPRGQQVAALIADVETGEVSPNQSIDVDPSKFVDPATANDLLFGSPGGPITPGNVNSGQSLAVTVSSLVNGTGSNIQGFVGGADMAFSGLWKFSAIIKAGDRGKSTSIVWQGSQVLSSAQIQAQAWAQNLANTFGNAGGDGQGGNPGPDLSKSAASPYIRAIRISDAINPRQGYLLKIADGNPNYCGFGTGAGNVSSADFIATALSLRLTATTTESVPPPVNIVNQIVFANHALLGIPDSVVIQGDQILTSAPVGVHTFSYYAGVYIAWITNPANRMGCITTPTGEKSFQCINFTRPANAPWQCTTTEPHGYNSGDRVRLTKCNAPFFAGTYKVNVLDATTIQFNNGPPASVAAPTTGRVRRFMTNDGVRLGVFAQFSLPATQTVDPWNLAVSKRNPGRAPSLVSFRRKPRRPH